ncbi:MAG: formylglycine-generating enzyme family protein [Gammaproteobacteria bacterium]|nr:formylglycine-generating enzyme family protein [Gammaproteobacteria bacterium]
MRKTQAVMIIVLGNLTACQATPSVPLSAVVQQLLDKTRENMVFVKGGSFEMGDYLHEYESFGVTHRDYWSNDESSRPAHKVTLSSYYMGKYEVTYAEYDIYTAANGLPLQNGKLKEINERNIPGNSFPFRKPNKPVQANWYEAKAYCAWLAKLSALPYDLPTEAQWEYAARSRGQKVGYATDNGDIDLDRNYPKFERYGHAVGKWPPNPLGLYDMSGNAHEWVNDWYQPDYYQYSPEHNPQGPKEGWIKRYTQKSTGEKKALGPLKISRGGHYGYSYESNDVYTRAWVTPDSSASFVGFRCALNLSTAPGK